MEDTGLAVSGLTKRFGSLVAVSDLSMHVQPGKILALLGPNGAGAVVEGWSLLIFAGSRLAGNGLAFAQAERR